MGKARAMAAGKRRVSLSNEATGDFKILVNEGARDNWVECEIAVNYEFDEIAVKPDNMVWFTADGRQADLIETIKGVRPIRLGGVASPNTSSVFDATDGFRSTKKKQRRLRRTFAERILVALDRLDRAGTAEAVSVLLRVNRGNVARCLAQLAASGILARDAAHLRPGEDRATLDIRISIPASHGGPLLDIDRDFSLPARRSPLSAGASPPFQLTPIQPSRSRLSRKRSSLSCA
jgi:hypothetical protein